MMSFSVAPFKLNSCLLWCFMAELISQQDNDPKDTFHMASNWSQQNKVSVPLCSEQSHDFTYSISVTMAQVVPQRNKVPPAGVDEPWELMHMEQREYIRRSLET